MLKFTVTNDLEGRSGFININVSEALYLESEPPYTHVVIHTADAKYYSMGTFKYFAAALEASGYNFFVTDKGMLINVNNIRSLDQEINVAYFEKDYSSDSKKCYISRRVEKRLLDFISVKGITI